MLPTKVFPKRFARRSDQLVRRAQRSSVAVVCGLGLVGVGLIPDHRPHDTALQVINLTFSICPIPITCEHQAQRSPCTDWPPPPQCRSSSPVQGFWPNRLRQSAFAPGTLESWNQSVFFCERICPLPPRVQCARLVQTARHYSTR